jgi:hypothetical protein
MLIGNLCALCGAAVLPIMSTYMEPLVNKELRGAIYVHLAMHSYLIVVFSYLLSIYMEIPVNIFSFDSVNGLLGIFSSW